LRNLYAYSVVSVAVAVAVAANAYVDHKYQYFPAAVHLVSSKTSSLAMLNFVFILSIYFAGFLKKIFLGSLRDVEMEHLSDTIPLTLLDTLLVMTIFREEISGYFGLLLGLMFLTKVFHLLVNDRVKYMEQVPDFSRFDSFRILILILLLAGVDLSVLVHTQMDVYPMDHP